MFLVIIIVIAIVIFIIKAMMPSDSDLTKQVLSQKRRTEEQKNVIRYFLNEDGGCSSDNRMSDSEFDAIVSKYINQDHRSRAMNRIGLDEEELREIEPICFHDYNFEKAYARKGADGLWRSSSYQISWLFFSANQLYFYQETVNFDCDEKRTSTEELYYKDVTSFSVVTETEEVMYSGQKVNVDSHKFKIIVPGDKFFASLQLTPENERAIQGMKAKLREKKNA